MTWLEPSSSASRLFDSSKVHTIDIFLEDWEGYLPRFLKVMPVGYKLLLEQESE